MGSPLPASVPALTQRALPYAALAGSMLSFCVGASLARQLFPIIGAQGAIAYRVGFSAAILLGLARPWRGALTRADLWATIRYGAALGLMNFTFYMALRTIPLGIAVAIEFLGPLAIALIHARRLAHLAIAGLAAAGLAMLLPLGQVAYPFDRAFDRALDPTGVAFALAAALFWGLYILFGKRVGHLPGQRAVALGLMTAALLVVPVGIAHAGFALLSLPLAALGLVVAILSSAIPYSLEMVALRRIPAGRFGILMSLEPAIGAVAGWLLLGQQLSLRQCVAIALVMAASMASVMVGPRPGRKISADAAPPGQSPPDSAPA